MRSLLVALTVIALLLAITPADATVQVSIDLSHQRMRVVSPQASYDWPISSARSGFSTPGGSYAPTRLELMHYSKKYDMSPMPHAIFFRGGYAIHGSYAVGSLGRPASHGCVRLSPGNAATLYDMVKAEGARISIHGRPPASQPFARKYYAGRGYGSNGLGYDDVPDWPARTTRRSYRRDDSEEGYGDAPATPYPAYAPVPAPYYE